MTDPTQPRTPRTEAGNIAVGMIRQQVTSRERLTPDGMTVLVLAIEDAAVAPYVEALTTIRGLHPRAENDEGRPWCMTCGDYWPCRTAALTTIAAVPEPPAAQPDAWLEVERLAVVAAARRFLAAHDHVIASAGVTRDDTFAMKNRVDELRDVLRLYDENAARLSPRPPHGLV